MRRRRWALLIAVAALLVLAPGAATVARADYSYSYCRLLTSPHAHCADNPPFYHAYVWGWRYNQAAYYGDGSISVCELAHTSGGYIASRHCNSDCCYANEADSGTELLPHQYSYLYMVVGNGSGYPHTITGFARNLRAFL